MSPELRIRFERGQDPFGGWTVQGDTASLESLRKQLKTVSKLLYDAETSLRLSWFKDWFFHDGTLSQAKPFACETFERMLATDEDAARFCVGDDLCTFAIVPDDYSWLLLIDVPEEQEESRKWQGRFTLAGSLPLVQAIVEALFPFSLRFQPTSELFVRAWER